MDIQQFLKRFERDIIEVGVIKGVFSNVTTVPTSHGKLYKTGFAKTVGQIVDSPLNFCLDYYGHKKKSKGFFEHVFNLQKNHGVAPKAVDVITVHFESIKDKHFHKLAPNDPEFLGSFFTLKHILIRARWGI